MAQADIRVTIPTYIYVGSFNPVGPIHRYQRTPQATSAAPTPQNGIPPCRHRLMSAASLPGRLTLAIHLAGPAPGSPCRISIATSATPDLLRPASRLSRYFRPTYPMSDGRVISDGPLSAPAPRPTYAARHHPMTDIATHRGHRLCRFSSSTTLHRCRVLGRPWLRPA